MDLTNSTKLVSTDMIEGSNAPGIGDITMSKESILNGKLALFPRNFRFQSLCAPRQPGRDCGLGGFGSF